MRRLPVLPTLLVGLAVALMIGLGVWQLERKEEKEALLARYAAAQGLPPIPWPTAVDPKNPPLYRRSTATCSRVESWQAQGGRNAAGETGWLHIARCPEVTAVMGWSTEPTAPRWQGGQILGVIGPDRDRVIRLIAADPAPGMQPARPPSLEDVPNNHLLYALQWFFFAAAAAVIYVLALRRRSR